MGFGILRVEKIKTHGGLSAALAHGFREREVLNADPKRAKDNYYFMPNQEADQSTKDKTGMVYEYHKAAIDPLRKRKDSVLALEYVITGSPEVMSNLTPKQQLEYLHDSLEWVFKRHGQDKAAILAATFHLDESTPHLHVYVIPKGQVKDKHKHTYAALTARPYTGGSKVLAQMQTEFARDVGAKYGLLRGIEGSRARHDKVQRAYGALARGPRQIPQIMLPALENLPDNKKDLALAVADNVFKQMLNAWGDRQVALELIQEKKDRTPPTKDPFPKKPKDRGQSR